MTHARKNFGQCRVAFACGCLATIIQASAEDIEFIGLPTGGVASLNDPTNWFPNRLPGPGDNAWITDDDSLDRIINVETAISLDALFIGNTRGGLTTLYQTGNLTATSEFIGNGLLQVPSPHYVASSRAQHIQDGGKNSVGYLVLGDVNGFQEPTSGKYILTSGTLNATNLAVGLSGYGTFEQNGGVANLSILTISSRPEARGVYELSGGILKVSRGEDIGYGGFGTFVHSAGSHVVEGALSLGQTNGSLSGGSYILNGPHATLLANIELIARHSPGTFTQSAGNHTAEFSTIGYLNNGHYKMSGGSFNVLGDLTLGFHGRGTFNLTNESAALNVKGTEYVGYFGRGTFVQTAGTHAIGNVLDVGGSPLDGESSQYRMEGGSLKVGGSTLVGVNGRGVFLQSGGTFSTGAMVVGSEGSLAYVGGTLEVGSLFVSGQLRIGPASGRTLLLNSLEITATGKVDLSDGNLVIDYTDSPPLAAIRDFIASDRLYTSFGSSELFAVGYADNAVVGSNTFGGQQVGVNSLLIKTTYTGDSNLDGSVDHRDFTNFLRGFAPLETGAYWLYGDFDYSASVDLTDFRLFFCTYTALSGSVEQIVHQLKNSRLSETEVAAIMDVIANVPEPVVSSMIAASLTFLVSGRARRLIRSG